MPHHALSMGFHKSLSFHLNSNSRFILKKAKMKSENQKFNTRWQVFAQPCRYLGWAVTKRYPCLNLPNLFTEGKCLESLFYLFDELDDKLHLSNISWMNQEGHLIGVCHSTEARAPRHWTQAWGKCLSNFRFHFPQHHLHFLSSFY